MTQVFTRKASGLVRSVPGRDVFIYNLGIVNLAFGISYILGFGLPFYPGANLILSIALVAVFCVFQAMTYYFFSVTFPRSGGEYVYISRTMHPAVGFTFSFSTVLWMLFYTAWSAANFSSLGLGSLCTILGVRLQSQALLGAAGWLQTPSGMFIVGTLITLLMTGVFVLGLRPYLRVQFWCFVLAMAGILALFTVLLTTGRGQFVAAFNDFARTDLGNNAYQKVLEVARSSGWIMPGFSWTATVGSMVWPLFPLAYSWMSTGFGSEIRRVERSQLLGMPGALLFAAAVFIAVVTLAGRVMGLDFLGAISWNVSMAPEGSTAITPWFHLLASLPSQSILLVVLITLGFVVWTQFWVAGDLFWATRVIFAWALDRVVPDGLGKVHPKWRTPVNSIILCTIVTEVFLFLLVFTKWFANLLGALPIALMYTVLGVAAVLFPLSRSEMFRGSPISRYRLGRVPALAVVGAVTALFMGYMSYLMFKDQLASGPRTTALISATVPLALGLVTFFVARHLRRKRGVDISTAQRSAF